MQNYQDKYLKERVELIAQSQANGKLVAIETEHSDYYPLPAITELPGVRAARYGGYEINSFPFRRSGVPGAWDITCKQANSIYSRPKK